MEKLASWGAAWREVIDAVYPPICYVCGAAAEAQLGDVGSQGGLGARSLRNTTEDLDAVPFDREEMARTSLPDGAADDGERFTRVGDGPFEGADPSDDVPRETDRLFDVACRAHRLPLRPVGARCPKCAARLPRALDPTCTGSAEWDPTTLDAEASESGPSGSASSDSARARPAPAAPTSRCAACVRKSPGLDATIVLADYRRQPEIREWILAFKHGGRRDFALPLGAALARCAGAGLGRTDRREVLVPVPLHLWRRIERGYDQAALLANAVGAASRVRVVRALRRVRATAVQGGVGSVSRSANVRGAFRPIAPLWLARRALARADYVWLVDDVFTSGSTLRECARMIRRLGVRQVGALALARAAARSEDTGSARGGSASR